MIVNRLLGLGNDYGDDDVDKEDDDSDYVEEVGSIEGDDAIQQFGVGGWQEMSSDDEDEGSGGEEGDLLPCGEAKEVALMECDDEEEDADAVCDNLVDDDDDGD